MVLSLPGALKLFYWFENNAFHLNTFVYNRSFLIYCTPVYSIYASEKKIHWNGGFLTYDIFSRSEIFFSFKKWASFLGNPVYLHKLLYVPTQDYSML